ncbi:hypothetical protein PAXRUDRAFT_241480 [Paxillus rubicundulus Ve08.2h10]|uniref:Uncharacterized protein n=1 Tax=Paxillus rubicundulus Ve08.2h10 TaxID=930991 RepID=A0A0D0DNR0_9AGAM|nr:hypothetical protein PAXRUDRAFT_241480 [Paxillus rubicundulus Ve08.2h10]
MECEDSIVRLAHPMDATCLSDGCLGLLALDIYPWECWPQDIYSGVCWSQDE